MDTSNLNISTRKGREHYSHAIADAWKNKLRKEADGRQAEHDALSTKEKLDKAKYRVSKGMGNCAKEIAKLTKKLEWEKAQKVTAEAQSKLAHPAPMTEAEKSVKAVKRAKAAATK